jgi:hypothetical protein
MLKDAEAPNDPDSVMIINSKVRCYRELADGEKPPFGKVTSWT